MAAQNEKEPLQQLQREALKELLERNKLVVRVVITYPDQRIPKGKLEPNRELTLTLRAGWSKIGPYKFTLVGGKVEETDYPDSVIPKSGSNQDETLQNFISGLKNAACREVLEELGVELDASQLNFVGWRTDNEWQSMVFSIQLPSKPSYLVKPDSAGTIHVDVTNFEANHKKDSPFGDPDNYLPGHFLMIQAVIKWLTDSSPSKSNNVPTS